MKIDFSRRFKTCLREAASAELMAVERACRHAEAAFGHPHRHAGVGLRRLGRNLFECRVNVHQRLVFSRRADALVFDFAGTHDEVQAYIRNR